MLRFKLFLIIVTLGLLSTTCRAQYDVDDRLKLEITPYVWLTTMNGDLTLNGETRPINFTFEDFFKFSNLGLNGHVELKKRSWAILFDYNYVDLIKDETYTELVLSELAFGWRLTKGLELIVGGRYFKSEIEYNRDDPEQIKKGKQSWIDPIIGGRMSWDMTKRLVFTARADIGGFGVGSEFEWNLMAGIGYRFSNITFLAAYRIWYAKYENGSGDNLFVYDMTTSGPGIAMVIHF
jgi:hypothetical protein